ncbi:MAG: response regulator transcription factor [Desulfovibrio sp.]|jgi:two-component system OmpR family response regulator|nr:response regulator transcription factor [Desulfovibrio sp.]
MRILLVEDDPQAASYLVKGLKEQGVAVDHVVDGREGLFRATSGGYDVIILDRMLPSLDGLSILKAVRAAGDTTPVLVLSALSDVDARVEGLRAGGDDYLPKPFAFAELMARVEALGRRGRAEKPLTILSLADLELDLTARTVKRSGKVIDLKPKEFALLEYFMRHAGQVVTRTMLLERVWDYAFDPQTNVIDVHVSRLRGKIDKDFDKPLLHTVRGAGYMLRDSTETS